ncbi:MAG: DNA adenine methylase [Enterococcus avium]
MKRILNYPGSKWTLAETICEIMPKHVTYLEPFFGSGAVFFTKQPSRIETINDLNGRVINFFKVCRDKPEELARKVALTPVSREEQCQSIEISADPVEDARRFLIQSRQSIGGVQRNLTGWRSNIAVYGSKTINEWNQLPELIFEVAGRLKGAQIENQDALQLLQRYNKKEVLAYVDPPYLLSTRDGRYYETELEDDQQPKLLEILNGFKGKIILSGYENDLYDSSLPDWHKLKIESNAESGEKRVEVLWCNFEPTGQISLFG